MDKSLFAIQSGGGKFASEKEKVFRYFEVENKCLLICALGFFPRGRLVSSFGPARKKLTRNGCNREHVDGKGFVVAD